MCVSELQFSAVKKESFFLDAKLRKILLIIIKPRHEYFNGAFLPVEAVIVIRNFFNVGRENNGLFGVG